MAAVLACGEGARASHHSGGHLFGILRFRPIKPHVTVPTTAGRTRPGILVHRVRELHRDDVTSYYEPRRRRRQGRLPLAQRELTVELLSYRFHGSRHAFEADIARRRRSTMSPSAPVTCSSVALRRPRRSRKCWLTRHE
jgi:hypothetical protein